MIRGIIAGARFGLLVVVAFATVEIVLALADTGGWIRFIAALAICAVAVFMLPRMLHDLVVDEAAR